MNGPDPSASLASLLAILSQTTQIPTGQSNQPRPSSINSPLEPVFVQGDILETTQWIGSTTTSWYEPRTWQLPRLLPAPQITSSSSVPRIGSPTSKRKRSHSPPKSTPPLNSQTTISFPTYSHALKHVVLLSQSETFITALRDMRKNQNNLESDLLDERQRITRKYKSKRTMATLLQSLGSQNNQDKLREEETAELKTFDLDVVKKWGDLICEQRRMMEKLNVPYFEEGNTDIEHRRDILAFLEDLIPGENES